MVAPAESWTWRDGACAGVAALGAAFVYAWTERVAEHGDVWLFVDALARFSGATGASHHPLYLPTSLPLTWLGLEPHDALIWHARLCAASAVGAAVLVARSMGVPRWEALALSAALAFTPVAWFFATGAEVHAFQLLMVMLAVLAALCARAARARLPRCAWLGCSAALALLSHPVNALGLPALWLLALPSGPWRRAAIASAWAVSLAFFGLAASGVSSIGGLLPELGGGAGPFVAIGGWTRASLEASVGIGARDVGDHAWLEWIAPQAFWVPVFAWIAVRSFRAADPEPARWGLALAAPFLLLPPLLRVREFGGYYAVPLAFAFLAGARAAASTFPERRHRQRLLCAAFVAVQACCGAFLLWRYERLGSDAELRVRVLAARGGDPRPLVFLTGTQPRTNMLANRQGVTAIDLRWTLDHALHGERERTIAAIANTTEHMLATGWRVLWDGGIESGAPTLERLGPLVAEFDRRFERRALAAPVLFELHLRFPARTGAARRE